MFKIFDMIFFFGVLIFLGWVFVGSTPGDRMSRTCAPIGWTGGLAEAGVEVFTAPGSSSVEWVRDKTADIDYGCQYIVWRTFYATPEQIAEREKAAAAAEEQAKELSQGDAEKSLSDSEASKKEAGSPEKETEQPKSSDSSANDETSDNEKDPLGEGAWIE